MNKKLLLGLLLVLLILVSTALIKLSKLSVIDKELGSLYEKINIIGETSSLGVYDPSVEYDQGDIGWLVYSAVEKPGYVDTHLAKTTDHGKTWEFVLNINPTAEGTLVINDETINGAWRHETPTLVYDPEDPDENKRWKLFWVKAFSRQPFKNRRQDNDIFYGYSQIMYKYASTPEGLSSAREIPLFRANPLPSPYTAKYNLNNIHPSPNDFFFFMEPGAIVKDGVLYLALHGVAWSLQESEIFLLSSKDHGETWDYVDTLTDHNDAKELGYGVLTASSLAEENGRVFLLVSPTNRISLPLPHLSYNGIYIFEFENLSQAKLERDENWKLIIHKYLESLSTLSVGGGQSDYHTQNTYGGIIMSQSDPTAERERFKIFNTKERIVPQPSTPLPSKEFSFGMEYAFSGLNVAKDFTDMGATWTKFAGRNITWGDIEPNPPIQGRHTYNWQWIDQGIKEYQQAGFKNIIITLHTKSFWGTTNVFKRPELIDVPGLLISTPIRGNCQEKNPEYGMSCWKAFEDFVYNFVERYDGDGIDDMLGLLYPVLDYEILSEAQHDGYFQVAEGQDRAEEYLKILKTSHRAAKKANPETRIILSGLVFVDQFDDGNIRTDEEHVKFLRETPVRKYPFNLLKRWQFKKAINEWTLPGLDFNRKVLAHPELFDIVEFHMLTYPTSIPGTVHWIREQMQKNSYQKPIWIGDSNSALPLVTGIHIFNDPPYPKGDKLYEIIRDKKDKYGYTYEEVNKWYRAEQAKFTAKVLFQAMGLGLEGVNFWHWTDVPAMALHPLPQFHSWAFHGFLDTNLEDVINNNGPFEKRPVYYTYKLIIDKLKGFSSVKTLHLGDNIFAYEFKVNGKTIYVLWYDDNINQLPDQQEGSTVVDLSSILGSQNVKVIHIITEQCQTEPKVEIMSANDILITETPVFVEVEQDSGILPLSQKWGKFKNPQKVEIIGYDGDALEPFISRDGQYLFFNNGYEKGTNTDLYYAKKIDEGVFKFMGEVKGVNTESLEAVAAMDDENVFYFVSTRDNSGRIYSGTFKEGYVSNVKLVPGNINNEGKQIMGSEITPDGEMLYFVTDLREIWVANKVNGEFIVTDNSQYILKNINSDKLEYAPAISSDGLEIFFTRIDSSGILLSALLGIKPKIYKATRNNISEPFGVPVIIDAVVENEEVFVEAPTITGDGKTLYYHKKEGGKFSIFKVTRDEVTSKRYPPRRILWLINIWIL